jgi:hypothetical protein
MELNLLIALAGIFGSGLSAYVGVRVALAELRGDIRRLDKSVVKLEERASRLEQPYFDRERGEQRT